MTSELCMAYPYSLCSYVYSVINKSRRDVYTIFTCIMNVVKYFIFVTIMNENNDNYYSTISLYHVKCIKLVTLTNTNIDNYRGVMYFYHIRYFLKTRVTGLNLFHITETGNNRSNICCVTNCVWESSRQNSIPWMRNKWLPVRFSDAVSPGKFIILTIQIQPGRSWLNVFFSHCIYWSGRACGER